MSFIQERASWSAAIALASIAFCAQALAQTVVTNISPTSSSLDPTDPDGASGGRVNRVVIDPSNAQLLYAASEWGGLFKSTDGGQTWGHLPGHVPTVTWAIKVDPTNSNRVYATSWYDGRVNSLAGISVSLDGGLTWTRPATAMPPVGFCLQTARRDEPSAFGIAIDPANAANIYVGTNCGLASSIDSGVTWRFIDPTPADGADNIWDVVVQTGGIIDVCGDDGHLRSTDSGLNWTTANPVTAIPLPSGRCSLAVSPDEPYVLFATVGTSIFESDNAGGTWAIQYVNPRPQGRIPFVATNKRAGQNFDLWFGDVRLHRGACVTPNPAAQGGTQRCQQSANWAGPFTRTVGGHDDVGSIAFAPGIANDACPVIFSSDGGVYLNTQTASPACHTPAWEQPTITPTALWVYGMSGVTRAGTGAEDIYFGNQDNGTFATQNAGASPPNWTNADCCDSFSLAAESTQVLYNVCCFGATALLFLRNSGMTGGGEINTYPPGNVLRFTYFGTIRNFAPNAYVLVTSSGVFITQNITANPIVWTQLGAATSPAGACGVRVADDAGTPTFFVKTTNCNFGAGQLFRFNGTGAGNWTQVVLPAGGGGFGVLSIDPSDPDRIIAAHLPTAPALPQMMMTLDGGTTWNNLAQLDTLMTGNGVFRYRNTRGPTEGTIFGGYVQPRLVAFDPANTHRIVAGGADSGVFLSNDGGLTWATLTNPLSPSQSSPHIPRPNAAHFETIGALPWWRDRSMYIASQGRGIWRISTKTRVAVFKKCALSPWLCKVLDRFDKGRINIDCNVRGCVVFDPIPKNCLYKFKCPGCAPGSLCPPYYNIEVKGIGKAWRAVVVDREGHPVEQAHTQTKQGLMISFRPRKADYIEQRIADYMIGFEMTQAGKPGSAYPVNMSVTTSNKPFGTK